MTTMHTATGFRASVRLSAHLQRILIDLITLQLNAKQTHWNLVGRNFRDLHLQLDEIVDLARESADTVAERMRAVHAVPDGRPTTVAADTDLPQLPPGEQNTSTIVDLMTDQLYRTAGALRTVHDEVDAEDPTTADLLHQIIGGIEKQAWMLGSESRSV
ncbi:Dps family protein [Nocardia jiangxiensis]|uniref:Dps family protein n=1 Tax=Nocardia jiangxiensis TaxID=282685 RepID=UPI0003140C53|nr:DNA starvation/stationary phase protection protein [Nocardia jiangxiensis]